MALKTKKAHCHHKPSYYFILNFLDYGDDKKKVKEEKKEDNKEKSQEEKRKHIKTLIDKIPTDKNALFAFQLDWAAVDNVNMHYYYSQLIAN